MYIMYNIIICIYDTSCIIMQCILDIYIYIFIWCTYNYIYIYIYMIVYSHERLGVPAGQQCSVEAINPGGSLLRIISDSSTYNGVHGGDHGRGAG